MAKLKYAYQGEKENTARALGKGMSISTKEAYEIANAIRRKPVPKAKSLLQDVVETKRAIPFRKYNKGISHRAGTGPGRYPVSASYAFLGLLEELEANAESLGLTKENLSLCHVAVHNAGISRSYRKGRPHHTSLTHVEMVAVEKKGDK